MLAIPDEVRQAYEKKRPAGGGIDHAAITQGD
jgi:hypothetical protein